MKSNEWLKQIDILTYTQKGKNYHHETLYEHICENIAHARIDKNYDDYKIVFACESEDWDRKRKEINVIKKAITPEYFVDDESLS